MYVWQHDLKADTISVKNVTILNDFVDSMIFWADACVTQYEFIVVNGQTTTSGFRKVVQQQYYNEMGKTKVTYINFLSNVACPKLLKSANFSRSYSKNNTGSFFWDTVYICHFSSTRSPRSTQPGHSSVGERNEYQRQLWRERAHRAMH